MPTYVYKFIDGGETIEVVQPFTDPTLTEAVHPVTGELQPVKKVFTPVGVTFRGDGFYKTDNRGGNGKKSTNGAAETAGASTSGDGSASGGSASSGSGAKESGSKDSGSKESASSSASASTASSSTPSSSSSSSSSD